MPTTIETAFSRVREKKNPLTQEQFAAFINKKAELKAKHGEGPEARTAILEGLYTDVDRDVVVFLLDSFLWNLWILQMKTGFSDADLIANHSDETWLNFSA